MENARRNRLSQVPEANHLFQVTVLGSALFPSFFFVFLVKSFVFLFFKLLDLLLETKVNGCVRDVKHRTPLHLAAERGTARQVKVLTQAAPSCVWMRDDQRRTPLHYAVMSMKRYNNFQFLQDLNTREPFFVNTFIKQAHRCLRTVLCVPKLSADYVQFLPLYNRHSKMGGTRLCPFFVRIKKVWLYRILSRA